MKTFCNSICITCFSLWTVCSAVCITSCVSLPITDPLGPGGATIAFDAGGFTVNKAGYDHLRGEGVPDSDFTVTAQGFHITNLAWHDAHAIQLNRANPAPKGSK